MYKNYFIDWEVRPEFHTEYVTLWPNWLGKEKLHLLDKVTEQESNRFNNLIELISQDHKIGLVNCSNETISFPKNIKTTFSTYSETLEKDATQFSKYVLPDLNRLITEAWDYTYILWHKNNNAVQVLSPYVTSSKLRHFSDKRYA